MLAEGPGLTPAAQPPPPRGSRSRKPGACPFSQGALPPRLAGTARVGARRMAARPAFTARCGHGRDREPEGQPVPALTWQSLPGASENGADNGATGFRWGLWAQGVGPGPRASAQQRHDGQEAGGRRAGPRGAGSAPHSTSRLPKFRQLPFGAPSVRDTNVNTPRSLSMKKPKAYSC